MQGSQFYIPFPPHLFQHRGVRSRPRLLFAGLALSCIAWSARPLHTSAPTQAASATLHWYKGNTHTHTVNSDGDSTPDEVARWYREHGYRFLILSDHNFLTTVEGLNALHGADEQFLLIKGEEVTDRLDEKPIHVNGLDVSGRVDPQRGHS